MRSRRGVPTNEGVIFLGELGRVQRLQLLKVVLGRMIRVVIEEPCRFLNLPAPVHGLIAICVNVCEVGLAAGIIAGLELAIGGAADEELSLLRRRRVMPAELADRRWAEVD